MNQLIKIISLSVVVITINFNVYAHGDKDKESTNAHFSGVETAPGKVVQQFHRALENADKVLARSLLSDDVIIFEGGQVERSADEYAHHHMLADMKYLAKLKVETIEHQVIVSENMAVSISRSQSTGKYNGKNVDRLGMETIVLKKVDGSWKIVRIHWS